MPKSQTRAVSIPAQIVIIDSMEKGTPFFGRLWGLNAGEQYTAGVLGLLGGLYADTQVLKEIRQNHCTSEQVPAIQILPFEQIEFSTTQTEWHCPPKIEKIESAAGGGIILGATFAAVALTAVFKKIIRR